MLDYNAVGRLPDVIRLVRNGREITVRRVEIGRLEIADGSLRVADPEFIDQVPPLPLTAPDGTHTVFAYRWDHPRGWIDVCAVVQFRPQRWATARPLRIDTAIRPDLTEGIIVDSGQAAFGGRTVVTFAAGQGDGYYPVIACRNLAFLPQAVIVDFKLWDTSRLDNVILFGNQQLDEYGIVVPRPDADASS